MSDRNPHDLGKHIWYYIGSEKVTFCLDVDKLPRIGGGVQFDLPARRIKTIFKHYDLYPKKEVGEGKQ